MQCDWIYEYRFVCAVNECQGDNIEMDLKELGCDIILHRVDIS
jgi:hypothetical protein